MELQPRLGLHARKDRIRHRRATAGTSLFREAQEQGDLGRRDRRRFAQAIGQRKRRISISRRPGLRSGSKPGTTAPMIGWP